MKFVADLHLHSKYSRAVSQDMILPKMAEWARLKGIDVLATGDFTHPFWFEQLKNELEEAENGLYRLKANSTPASLSPSQRLTQGEALDFSRFALDRQDVYFLLSCEISSIYSQGGKGRRVHNLVFFPTLESVSKFNNSLLKRKANLRSDGRPIVGLTSRELAHLAFEVSDKALVIPAHIWTPWFSLYGSFSGFDSIEECFGDVADKIYGIETGLSSDPAMNWQIADLDERSILSFSDAHSLEKMGREATVFEGGEISYETIYDAILGKWEVGGAKLDNEVRSEKSNFKLQSKATPPSHIQPRISYTIEFYPEEGKYHFTGHRDCNFSQSPEETKSQGDICPVCKRKLTVGVMHRVNELKIRNPSFDSKLAQGEQSEFKNVKGVKWTYPRGNSRPAYVNLVPLAEIISEVEGTAVKTKRVFDVYSTLVSFLGSEFNVLLKASVDDLKRYASNKIVEGIERVRSGNINIDPGYDGKFGEVKIWSQSSLAEEKEESQLNLFA